VTTAAGISAAFRVWARLATLDECRLYVETGYWGSGPVPLRDIRGRGPRLGDLRMALRI